MCQPFKYKYYESAKNLPIYLPKDYQYISILDVVKCFSIVKKAISAYPFCVVFIYPERLCPVFVLLIYRCHLISNFLPNYKFIVHIHTKRFLLFCIKKLFKVCQHVLFLLRFFQKLNGFCQIEIRQGRQKHCQIRLVADCATPQVIQKCDCILTVIIQ